MRYRMTKGDVGGSYHVRDEDGNVVLRDENYVIASNVEYSLNNDLDHLFGECGEVASWIRSNSPISDTELQQVEFPANT